MPALPSWLTEPLWNPFVVLLPERPEYHPDHPLRKQGLRRSGMTDGYGIPPGLVLAGANRHDSPLLAPALDRLNDLGPLPDDITVHPDAGYDSDKTRTLLNERGLHGRIAHGGAPMEPRSHRSA
ncbi:hypothetical protein TNCT6_18270 [Streptomyces sp. 6-11-2]|nr:hypothetical protein TNCT6_18270 [Streptomyces sp. 6-11-2]